MALELLAIGALGGLFTPAESVLVSDQLTPAGTGYRTLQDVLENGTEGWFISSRAAGTPVGGSLFLVDNAGTLEQVTGTDVASFIGALIPAAGPDMAVQYNDGGIRAGEARFLWDDDGVQPGLGVLGYIAISVPAAGGDALSIANGDPVTQRAINASGAGAAVFDEVWLDNGSLGSPALAFVASATTGLYRFAADVIGFAAGGVAIMQASATEVTIDGKLTVTGLIDPTGLELTPVAANPGLVPATTLWSNSGAGNALYYGASAVGGGGGGSPGGANTNVQFNSAGAFGGDANFTYTAGTKVTVPAGSSAVPSLQFIGAANRGLFKTTNGIGITDGAQYVEWYPFSGALVADTGGGLTSFDQYIGAVLAYSVTTSRLRIPAGTVAAPGVQFTGFTDHGVYPTTAGVSFALGGSQHLEAGRSGVETYFDTPGSSTTMGFYLGAVATHKATTSKFSVPAGSAGAPGLQFLTGVANVGLFNYGGAAPGLGFSLNASATESMWASAVVPGYVRWDTGSGMTRWQWFINGVSKMSLDATTGLSLAAISGDDGAAGTPSHTFTSDPDTGIYRLSANVLGFTAGGATTLSITATEATITGGLVVTGSVAIRDSAFVIQDGGDLTKQAAFQCSGITTGTTRTFTFPDASGTLALLGLAQTWPATQSFAAINASGAVTLADTVLAGYLGAVEDDAGTTRNVTTTDTGAVIRFTSGSAITVTLNASAAVGTTMTILQYGAGQITFTPAGGATLVNRQTHTKTAGQYAAVSLVVLANAGAAAIWALAGDTAV